MVNDYTAPLVALNRRTSKRFLGKILLENMNFYHFQGFRYLSLWLPGTNPHTPATQTETKACRFFAISFTLGGAIKTPWIVGEKSLSSGFYLGSLTSLLQFILR